MKKIVLGAGTLFLLLVPLTKAFASPPPCARGEIYVGGASFYEAICVPSKYLKIGKALKRSDARRTILGPTRRSRTTATRKVYLHPAGVRATRAGIYSPREVRLRRHAVKYREIPYSLRPSQSTRRYGAAAQRRDYAPRARRSRRTNRLLQQAQPLHGSSLRLRTGR